MTPCKKLGYKVGDQFEVVLLNEKCKFKTGDIITMLNDDNTDRPLFKRGDGVRQFVWLSDINPIAGKITQEQQQ